MGYMVEQISDTACPCCSIAPDSTGKSNVLFFSGSGNSLGQIPDGGVVVDYINQNFSGVIAAQ
jgi:hypothetical protein